jgi:hypothetical protein
MELIALGGLYGLQIIISLYLLNDFYYTNITGDKIGAFFIILSLLIVFIANTIIIYGLISFNINYTIQNKSLELNTIIREALSTYEFLYIINYAVLIILNIIYFLSFGFKIPSINDGGLSGIECFTMFIKFVFSIVSIGLGVLMVYNANIFASLSKMPVINIKSI